MKLGCSQLEALLEALAAGSLGAEERLACETHLRQCERCAELAQLATVQLPAAPQDGPDLTAAVLRRTSGPACDRAEALLASVAPGGVDGAEAPLLALHLEHCGACRALGAALAALERDLPALAEMAPDPGFTGRVLAASLPPEIRLRRWWRRTGGSWVRRPRFALEMAYAMTALCVVLFSIPGSPLEAMPRQAVDLARNAPIETLGEPVRQGLAAWESSASRRLRSSREITESRIRTFLDGAASWWENATEDSSSRQVEKTEETS